ncbi:DUF397 domain-containing protein [Streptomyces sp. MMS24-I2-30]|uniref:DUF397 domain-containing protein n=1 Tax=Streptomyces sp. MMS24-I2-30 TaxID=3351564 RepID=UPI003896EB09
MNPEPKDGNTELDWFKSSYSTPDGAACVEAASALGTIHIRDSKHQHGPQLTIGPEQWSAFVSYATGH